MSAASADAPRDGASSGRLAGVVVLSLLTPGLGHIKLGRWQVGLILVGLAQCLIVGLRAVPHLMAPTPRALLLMAAIGLGLVMLFAGVALHAFWLARREVIEIETIGPAASVYVPLPLDVRVAGLSMTDDEGDPGSARPWFMAMGLILAGVAGVVLLPAKWALVTMPEIAMGPTLSAGDRVLVDLHRTGLVPRRGEVVLLHSDDGDAPFLVRRAIGLAGDRIVLRRLSLTMNGNRLPHEDTREVFTVDGVARPVSKETLPFAEPYRVLLDVGSQMVDEARLVLVQPGQVFVMRDDRVSPVSSAGSVAGFAPINEVEGTVTTILWKRGGGFLQRL